MTFRLLTASAVATLCLFGTAAAQDSANQRTSGQKPTLQAHLASYKQRAAAEKGWRELTEQYSSVLYFSPQISEVDLPGKGKWLRVYAEGDEELMRSLCKSMKARKLYCALTDGDGKFLRD